MMKFKIDWGFARTRIAPLTAFILAGVAIFSYRDDLLPYGPLLTPFVLAISVSVVFIQMRTNHDWNRRKASYDLLFSTLLGPFRELRWKLEKKIDIYSKTETYDTKKQSLDADDCKVLESMLNCLENICLAMKNHVVDERILFDCLAAILIYYRRWAHPYIVENRLKIESSLWIEIDPYARQWALQMGAPFDPVDPSKNVTVIGKGLPKL